MRRVIIVHRWSGTPEADWYPWLKNELEDKGFSVIVPEMPDTAHPRIKPWVEALRKAVGSPDADTFFVGHSVGCQTILRYLSTLPATATIGGAIFIAGWLALSEAVMTSDVEGPIARPWLEEKFSAPTRYKDRMVAVFSEDDPYVPLVDNKRLFSAFCSRIIIEKGKGHYDEDTGIREAPTVLKELLRLAGN